MNIEPFNEDCIKSFNGLTKIGKGEFTTAYRDGDTVYLQSVDRVKECMSLGWFPKHRLFPVIKKIGSYGDGYVYKMKFYNRPKSLKTALLPSEWELYSKLRKITVGYAGEVTSKRYPYEALIKVIENIFSDEDDEIRIALIEAVEALTSYSTGVRFEISPRNVAVENGKLILLDCFFIRDL